MHTTKSSPSPPSPLPHQAVVEQFTLFWGAGNLPLVTLDRAEHMNLKVLTYFEGSLFEIESNTKGFDKMF